ncbi:MAG: rod shape-determining protein MreD [Solirubrobacterales bacterium]
MTVTGSSIARVAALVIVTVVVQISVVTQVTFWGAYLDLLPLVALSVGLLAGPITGASVGFALGLVADMALFQTLGVSSLLLTGVGYQAGRYRELRDASHKMVPAIGGFVVTLAYATAFSIVQFLLGVDSDVSSTVIRTILVGALLNALIATPVFKLVRLVLRPALADDLRPRRRSTSPIGLRASQ